MNVEAQHLAYCYRQLLADCRLESRALYDDLVAAWVEIWKNVQASSVGSSVTLDKSVVIDCADVSVGHDCTRRVVDLSEDLGALREPRQTRIQRQEDNCGGCEISKHHSNPFYCSHGLTSADM